MWSGPWQRRTMARMVSAIIVGGGFFGTSIAHHLKTKRQFAKVTLIEREPAAMLRASYVNQARVHGGYHYLRSFTTAYRSRVNLARFCAEFSSAVATPYQSIYALAARQSKVTHRQVERFCDAIGAPLEPLPKDLWQLFDPRLISSAWLTEERVFDASVLRKIMLERLAAAGVEVRFGAEATAITAQSDRATVAALVEGQRQLLEADIVVNCTYSNLQNVAGVGAPDFHLCHEIAEIVLVDPPPRLSELGITVMDGPFFSMLPFPSRGLHSLTHVRYTPHRAWPDSANEDPDAQLKSYHRHSSVDWMIRDSSRYVPLIAECRPAETLFEVKTILRRNAGDDGRPILFERHGSHGRIISVLGGKLDNIYDALNRIDQETFEFEGSPT